MTTLAFLYKYVDPWRMEIVKEEIQASTCFHDAKRLGPSHHYRHELPFPWRCQNPEALWELCAAGVNTWSRGPRRDSRSSHFIILAPRVLEL